MKSVLDSCNDVENAWDCRIKDAEKGVDCKIESDAEKDFDSVIGEDFDKYCENVIGEVAEKGSESGTKEDPRKIEKH